MTNQAKRIFSAMCILLVACAVVVIANMLVDCTHLKGEEAPRVSEQTQGIGKLESVNVQPASFLPSILSSASDDEMQAIPETIFMRLTGNAPLSSLVSEAFTREVLPPPSDCLQHVSYGNVVCYVLARDMGATRSFLYEELAQTGWESVSDEKSEANDDAIVHCVFLKRTGLYRWVHIALYDINGATTCVFTTQEG